jgi:GNAT superfamily N-acetyltransferase
VASDFHIRPALLADGPSIVAMVREAIRVSATAFYSGPQIEAWASGWGEGGIGDLLSNTVAFVAESNGGIVGISNLDGSEVGQLFVRPSHGSRGVARALYEAVEAAARARSVERLTAVASFRSAPVFAKFGFTDDGHVSRAFNGATFDVVLVSKVLDDTDERSHGTTRVE